MLVEILDVDSGGGYGVPRWTRKKLLHMNVPAELAPPRPQIIADLVAAFTAYRGAGVLSENDAPRYSFMLDEKRT